MAAALVIENTRYWKGKARVREIRMGDGRRWYLGQARVQFTDCEGEKQWEWKDASRILDRDRDTIEFPTADEACRAAKELYERRSAGRIDHQQTVWP